MSSAHLNLMSDDGKQLLAKLAENVETARKRRGLKISTVCSRAGITGQTYQRLKQGNGSVTLAVLLNVLVALDLEDTLSHVADPDRDQVGLTLADRSLAALKRVRKEGEGDERQLDPNW